MIKSKKQSFTKGEWKVLGESSGNYISVGTDKKQVCKVNWGENDFDNANLIAAAPEMYEELKSVLVQLDRYSSLIPDGANFDGKAQSLDDAFVRIRRVLKKASPL